jgi:hypothetical protein
MPLNGLTGAGYTQDAEGRRIDGRRVLETYSPVREGYFNNATSGLFDQSFADREGFGDLWRTGYSAAVNEGFDSPGNRDATFSPELLDKLSQYQVARLGFGNDMRQMAVLDQAGNVVSGSTPKAYNAWGQDTLRNIALMGAGAGLNSAFGGVGEAVGGGEAFDLGGAFSAGEAGAGGLSGLSGPGLSNGLGVGMGDLGGLLGGPSLDLSGAFSSGGVEGGLSGQSGPGLSNGLGSGAGVGGGGGLLGELGSRASGAIDWLRNNPSLARGIFSLGGGLLGGLGGGAGSAPQETYGPPKQWKSPLQAGLLTPAEQSNFGPVSFKGRW